MDLVCVISEAKPILFKAKEETENRETVTKEHISK